MELDIHIAEIFKKQDDYSLSASTFEAKIIALYIFYHYMNADTSRLEEVTENIIDLFVNQSFSITSILNSVTNDNAIDFNILLLEKDYIHLSFDDIKERLLTTAKIVGRIIYHNDTIASKQLIDKYDALGVRINDDTSYVIRTICPFDVSPEEKILIQQYVAEIEVKNKNVYFEIIFKDDLEQEVSDIEKPKNFVTNGTLILKSESLCYLGEEKSFIATISAESLKKIFLQYSTKGLFASNLRFYITNKKIDSKIIETIAKEPDNFQYFNNGIIITCDNYEIKDKKLVLSNFSIVNGGQTTNLIGRTNINKDFGVVCKVIKNKYEDDDKKISFLSKVAEASNMQKPINAKDLIANKIEQRALKKQFLDAGMFLKIKRGEKLDKQTFPEPYMNASNDEVAQLLNSFIFQSPGASKSTKSSLLTNEKIYNMLFKNQYSSDFLKSMQYLKVAYSEWQKKVKKSESHSSIKFGLSKHANYMSYALIGYIFKFFINETLFTYISKMDMYTFSNKNSELKDFLKVNDIGNESLICPKYFPSLNKKSFFDLFEYLFDTFLIPSYQNFKKECPSMAYSNFCKTDSYYYDYVLKFTTNKLLNEKMLDQIENKFSLMNLNQKTKVGPDIELVDHSTDTMEAELQKFRNDVVNKTKTKINYNHVISRLQLSKIVTCFPRNNEDLKTKCSLSDNQIEKYSKRILEIVKKYIREEDFK